MIFNIFKELKAEEGTLKKIEFLKLHIDNNSLKRVFELTYDRVQYTYGISVNAVELSDIEHTGIETLERALETISVLYNRELTGNDARDYLNNTLTNLTYEDAVVFYNIIDRTQHLQLGRTQINKVWKSLITKQVYGGCDHYTIDKEVIITTGKKKGETKTQKGTANNIQFPAYIQLKSDGTYREFKILDNKVSCVSRSGKVYTYPLIENILSNSQDGYILGELTVILNDTLLEEILPKLEKLDIKNGTTNVLDITNAYNNAIDNKVEYTLPRGIANGLINSDKIPEEQIRFTTWDFITTEDYIKAAKKDRTNLPLINYKDRFELLIDLVNSFKNNNVIQITDYKVVNMLSEATDYVSLQLSKGLEGGILKDYEMKFKDGRSKFQLKMKLAFSIDCRITGFIEGRKGTVREETFGSVTFETDDGMIKGSTSGFNKSQLEDFNSRRDELIGSVIEIEANDLTRGRSNSWYALSHPRFITLRDKNTTDTFKSATDALESAKLFKV